MYMKKGQGAARKTRPVRANRIRLTNAQVGTHLYARNAAMSIRRPGDALQIQNPGQR